MYTPEIPTNYSNCNVPISEHRYENSRELIFVGMLGRCGGDFGYVRRMNSSKFGGNIICLFDDRGSFKWVGINTITPLSTIEIAKHRIKYENS